MPAPRMARAEPGRPRERLQPAISALLSAALGECHQPDVPAVRQYEHHPRPLALALVLAVVDQLEPALQVLHALAQRLVGGAFSDSVARPVARVAGRDLGHAAVREADREVPVAPGARVAGRIRLADS